MRHCIFCAQRADSREHVWPLWLQKRVNRGHEYGTITIWRGPNATPAEWSGANADLKVKYVCEPCNTGWMNTLETENKAIIGALVGDFTLPLDEGSQELIALWCSKTAMVLECVKPKPWFYSQADHHGFLANFRPPPETLVWIGRYAHHLGISSEGRRLGNDDIRADFPLREGYMTNFVFGRLVMQSLTVRRKPQFNRTRLVLDQRPGPWGQCLLQVWPIQNKRITWPPPISFSDAGQTLDSLAKRFSLKS